jgi:hypothetical protein
MTVYLCEGVHGGSTANRAESVDDIWNKSSLLLCIAIWIHFVKFEEGNQPSDFSVENVSDRNAPVGETGAREKRSATVRHRW